MVGRARAAQISAGNTTTRLLGRSPHINKFPWNWKFQKKKCSNGLKSGEYPPRSITLEIKLCNIKTKQLTTLKRYNEFHDPKFLEFTIRFYRNSPDPCPQFFLSRNSLFSYPNFEHLFRRQSNEPDFVFEFLFFHSSQTNNVWGEFLWADFFLSFITETKLRCRHFPGYRARVDGWSGWRCGSRDRLL